MLAEMPLSDYWRWMKRRRKKGLNHSNQEMLLQLLNANVLNASGRYQNTLTAEDFSLTQKPKATEQKGLGQSVLTQMLSERASLSFPPTAE
ncbi:hypothetical protein HUO05_23930 (plasmid) [Vibrio alginolyticus]|nr:hypothetical protein HUO05_23930 [Vibrio alginolyticus]RXP53124.1 hypothetical protein EGL72_25075 [Vibrio parahaemolyticus]RXP65360.1 hypothetical protein EGL71_25470 [Vibrio parahaemolyticus]RXP91055.1 hypothetical protein EGL68_25710 [Vibrio parahaemolyticus]RXQ11559.1 hypothetical protein EGL65_25580 [Vibrio parahaemolyticus]